MSKNWRLLRKQGAKLNKKIMKILPPNYPSGDFVVRGLSTNELKSMLPKRGYDIFCPSCSSKFRFGSHKHGVRCPSCQFTWRVNMYGRP